MIGDIEMADMKQQAAGVDLRQIDLRRPICPQIGMCALRKPMAITITNPQRTGFETR